MAGADPGFQVRGIVLKKIAPGGGRREIVWGISCEKNHDFTPKNHIFSNFRGCAPPGSAPAWLYSYAVQRQKSLSISIVVLFQLENNGFQTYRVRDILASITSTL
jgi:hypothetical protein